MNFHRNSEDIKGILRIGIREKLKEIFENSFNELVDLMAFDFLDDQLCKKIQSIMGEKMGFPITYTIEKSDEQNKAIFSVMYSLKEVPWKFDVIQEFHHN